MTGTAIDRADRMNGLGAEMEKVKDAIADTGHPVLRRAFELKALKGMDTDGRLLLEGLRLTYGAMRAEVPFEQILYAPEFFLDDRCFELVDTLRSKGVDTVRLARRLFSKFSYKAEGVLGIVRYVAPRLEEIRLEKNSLVMVLDELSDPGNMGGIIRTANALRVSLVIVTGPEKKLYHPKCLRATMGGIFHTPTVISNRDAAIDFARDRGLPIYTLTPDGEVSIYDLPLHDEFLLVVGNEKYGVHRRWKAAQTSAGFVPMEGFVDSLNATTSASVVLYEAYRQRMKN